MTRYVILWGALVAISEDSEKGASVFVRTPTPLARVNTSRTGGDNDTFHKSNGLWVCVYGLHCHCRSKHPIRYQRKWLPTGATLPSHKLGL